MRRYERDKKSIVRKAALISIIQILVLLQALSSAVTATQTIVLDITRVYEPTSSLRVFDGVSVENPEVTFPITHSGYYLVNDAGNTPWKDQIAFDDIEGKDGGYLQYTTQGYTQAQKITVHSPTSGYIPGSLWVKVYPPAEAGSNLTDPNSLGISVSGGKTGTDGIEGYIPILGSEDPIDVIQHVDGEKAWTGGEKNGAKIAYFLSEDPGLETFQLVYTLIAE